MARKASSARHPSKGPNPRAKIGGKSWSARPAVPGDSRNSKLRNHHRPAGFTRGTTSHRGVARLVSIVSIGSDFGAPQQRGPKMIPSNTGSADPKSDEPLD